MKSLLKRLKPYCKKNKKYLLLLFLFFLFGLILRFGYIFPDKIIFGYDQIGDVLNTKKIVEYHDFVIQVMSVNPSGIRHGALFNYFTAIFYFLGRGNPMTVAYGYALFNCLTIVSVYFFVFFVFRNLSLALTSAFLATVSYRIILMAGWISNTTAALYLTPVFFLGFWLFKKGRQWGLVLSAFLLGLLIQSQILMVYNFIAILVLWLVLKLRRPKFQTILWSLLAFCLSTSTMILTEIRSNFSGIKVFLHPAKSFDEISLPVAKRFLIFGREFLSTFSSNLVPQYRSLEMILGTLILLVLILAILYQKTKQEEKEGLKLLLVFLVSPIFMLIVGYHAQPWTLLGMIPAIFIAAAYVISKISSLAFKVFLLSLFLYLNITAAVNGHSQGKLFIDQEPSSTLKGQLAVIDYTYQKAEGKPFAINSVAYPLYNNTYWSYHYPWYGVKKYGYLPNWSGGEQLYPYNSLPRSDGKEKIYFMIIDETRAIPPVHKEMGRQWGQKYGKLVEEKSIGGFTVQKFIKLQ